MTTTVNRNALVAALRALRPVVGSNPSLPVLANVAIEVQDGSPEDIALTTTNLDAFARRYVPFRGDPLESTTVGAKALGDFAAGFSGEDVKLVLDGTRLRISSGRQKASLAVVDPEQFPSWPQQQDGAKSFTLTRDEFDAVTRKVAPFAAGDPSRPILTGVDVKGDGQTIRFAAADNYRVGVLSVDHATEVQAVIPAASLFLVGKVIEGDHISVTIDGRTVMFASNVGIMFSRLIEGQFPNIESVLPTSFKATALVSQNEFASAAKLAGLASTLIVKFEESVEGLRVYASDHDRDFDTTLEATISIPATEGDEPKPDVTFALNQKFVNDIASVLGDSTQVEIGCNGPLAPVAFRDPSDSSYRAVIMPVRTAP